ncbi:MAG: hypothetical protein F6K10_38295 [Moorea sp. SIO2B7]|nr:hypothetical protein [Moorena sp. SIO2B7]
MARAIEQIKQDLAALEENVATFAAELRSIYLKYLNLLSQSTQKQLVLASYQICTQAYPESFVKLSFNQRQQLQKNLCQLGKGIESELLSYLEEKKQSVIPQQPNIMEQMFKHLPIGRDPEKDTLQNPLSFQGELRLSNLEDEIEEEFNLLDTTAEEKLSNSTEFDETKVQPPNKPKDLLKWHKRVEQGIHETLETISREANHSLQQAGILPKNLPSKFLDMAIQSEESSEAISGPPNLLNMLIEAGDREESEDGTITKITAIRLRLSEIEFSDPILNAQRNQIRNLLAKIRKIRQQYQKKQRECAVAEAETAWRASWFDD